MTSTYNSFNYSNMNANQLHNHMYGGSIADAIKKFGTAVTNRAIDTGKIYYGASGANYKNLIPNFSDSMSQLYKGSSDFNQGLYDVLTEDEKNQLLTDFLASSHNPLRMIPFIGLFKDTREAADEVLGMRHPSILKDAIARYNSNIQKDMAQKQTEAKQKELLDMQQTIQNNLRDQLEANLKNATIPTEHLHVPVSQSHLNVESGVPIDVTRGRGLRGHYQKHHEDNVIVNY